MPRNELPGVSIVIPTYNSGTTLKLCLSSIKKQDYPEEKVEIIVVDGGSKDETIEIANRYGVDRILSNPLKTGEAGKAVGLRAAKFEMVSFVDSDNILPSNDWLTKIVAALSGGKVVGSEPIAWTYRPEDPPIVRYAALCGDNDPLGFYTGTRAHWSWNRSNWTDLPSLEVNADRTEDHVMVRLPKGSRLPSIGANGFTGWKKLLLENSDPDYYFDVDVVYNLVQSGFDTFAKVRVGVVHLHVGDLGGFVRKAYRRVRDFLLFRRRRVSPPPKRLDVLLFIFYNLTLLPLVEESVSGYRKKADKAWFIHPLACFLIVIVYGLALLGHIATRILGGSGA